MSQDSSELPLIMQINSNQFEVFDIEMLPNTTPERNLLFQKASDFSQFIETAAIAQRKTCTDVILRYCEDKDLDPEDIAKLVTPQLKAKLAIEMQQAGLIKANTTLDFE